MINWIKKYYRLLFAVAFTLAFALTYFRAFTVNYSAPVKTFQAEFKQLEQRLDRFLATETQRIRKKGPAELWSFYKQKNAINLHVFKHDSLVFWNTNQLPILRFADIHFPSAGILHLQNGWYYAKIQQFDDYVVCASFLIKNEYSYENKQLQNEFSNEFSLPFSAYIVLEQASGYPIYSLKKDYLFSIYPNEYQPAKGAESLWLLVLLVGAIASWMILFARLTEAIQGRWSWSFPLTIVLLRILSIKGFWFGFMHETESFASSLFGLNEWFPNFFEYLINCIIIVYVIGFIRNKISTLNSTKNTELKGIFLLLFAFIYWLLIVFLLEGSVENSSIPLFIDKLFTLNQYTVLAVASFGLLCYSIYQLFREIIRFLKRHYVPFYFALGVVLLLGSIEGICSYFFWYHFMPLALFLPLFLPVLVLFKYLDKKQLEIGAGLLYLGLFSGLLTLFLREFNLRKEKSVRELYANQLATEKDIVTEIEYSNVVQKIQTDEFLTRFIEAPYTVGLTDFEEGLERRIFNGFWERYDMGFNLFNPQNQSLILSNTTDKSDFDELNLIIEKHGSPSEIDSNFFFINDYTGDYSYIARQPIFTQDSSQQFILFCTFKSKKIPEQIGFPRLLISDKAKVFEPLENYSIAKYYDGHLVIKYGKFNYPSSDLALNNWKNLNTGYYNSDGYNHYALKKTGKDVIVLSIPSPTWLELVTSFSYLFTFFGLLLLPALYHFKLSEFFSQTLSLALKIQIVLIGLVFISLLAFGWGSGLFVSNQYNEFTNDVIREKLNSVRSELSDKMGNVNQLSIQKQGNYLSVILQNFSRVFVTDINLYDQKGFLIATSRPKIFNVGLLSEQMNADAFFQVDVKDKSEFIHQENIGRLGYSSAYIPFYTKDGKLLAYLNLQHFGQQKEFENQIQHFLVAIINVFMLLLAISIFIAIVVSSWVTSPLRLLQESFSSVKFGKENQPIEYTKQDEIGALVKDYNQKLVELELTAQQLAQSERETAWREMAKQVAHEIKNPLTPMKLSLQQLQRVYDPTDPQSKTKLDRVASSIIEQIDALTKIANEFSNFAKMPRPNETKFDLKPVIENVLEVFKDEENCSLSFTSAVHSCNVLADKDLMLRVFNNLVKNAIQAIPADRKGTVEVAIKVVENQYIISISDNGMGIDEEKQQKIFVPYFTTKSTGTGLGLAMVKQIIENHRGKIYFTTTPNVGTTFYVEIPKA